MSALYESSGACASCVSLDQKRPDVRVKLDADELVAQHWTAGSPYPSPACEGSGKEPKNGSIIRPKREAA